MNRLAPRNLMIILMLIFAINNMSGKSNPNDSRQLKLGNDYVACKLDISECYDMGDVFGAVHFENNGMMYADNGNMPGVYRIVGDTLAFDVYSQWGGWPKRTTIISAKCLIINSDSIEINSIALIRNGKPQAIRIPKNQSVCTHYDCPSDFKPNGEFLFKQKQMWEREEDWKQWMEEYKKNKKK